MTEIPEDLTTGRILIVEDSKSCQLILKTLLESNGYQVTVAGCCEEALSHCSETPPDVALVDYNLPSGNGDEVCKQMRDAGFVDVPIIITTGNQESDLKTRLVGIGATGFLQKPLDTGQVLIEVKTALKIRFLQQMVEKEKESLRNLEEKMSIISYAIHSEQEVDMVNLVDEIFHDSAEIADDQLIAILSLDEDTHF